MTKKTNTMPKTSYWVLARSTSKGREYFYGVQPKPEMILCGANFFSAWTFESEAAAQECIDKLLAPSDLTGFMPSACGDMGMSANLARAAREGGAQ